MFKRDLRGMVGSILEKEYKMDIATSDKVLDIFFSPDYLPRWYFYSNSVKTIARHIFLYTQLLSANSRYLEDVDDEGKCITYFVNVGRDNPGRLERLIEENLDMDIGSFNAEYTKSGVSIVSITKRGRSHFKVPEELWSHIKEILREAESVGKDREYKFYIEFLNSIQLDYLAEEVTSHSPGDRLYRHMELYEDALILNGIIVKVDSAPKIVGDRRGMLSEKRISIAIPFCDTEKVTKVLKVIEKNEISMNRVYYDLIEGESRVGILSIYADENIDLENTIEKIVTLGKGQRESNKSVFENRVDSIIRALTSLDSEDREFVESLDSLIELCRENSDIECSKEFNNFYLNSVTDFIKACDWLGIKEYNILSKLLGYEALDEFFVSCREGNSLKNKPGFRAKHNSARGPNKGGLRIDPIVRFDEVAALSFMMTWKCARSKILFGGGKGGLMLNPSSYIGNKLDFYDTLSNFGRSIFCVTGPSVDVPAGDVGCGGKEIGHLFEGFKSALRDLSLLALGVKKGVSMIGNKIISVEEARTILLNNFSIDYLDKRVLEELATSEEYLNLVVSPQITGKPIMGIEARTGATGRGLCYSILAMASNLYLDGKWEVYDSLTDDEEALLEYVSTIDEKKLADNHNSYVISPKQWSSLILDIYPKLFRDKRVVIQGYGKVGSSVARELSRFGVKVIGVADAGGAVVGHSLDHDQLDRAVVGDSRSVTGTHQEVDRIIEGAKEGSQILTLECDILIPAALENSITMENVHSIDTRLIACGSNGPCSSKAEEVLFNRGITVIYDFLANGAGVSASYFEWLRNLSERFKYESEVINSCEFNPDIMDEYIMPEFKGRIKDILREDESLDITEKWNGILRDIIFTQVNEDYLYSKNSGISLKTAGFSNAILRVITAIVVKSDSKSRIELYNSLGERAKNEIREFFNHPEAGILSNEIESIKRELFS